MEEPTDTSSAERTQLYKSLADGRPGWARLMRRMLDAEAPPTDVGAKKAPPRKAREIPPAIKSSRMLQGVGGLSRPRQEAADLFPGALRKGSKACPPCVSFLTPNA